MNLKIITVRKFFEYDVFFNRKIGFSLLQHRRKIIQISLSQYQEKQSLETVGATRE